MDMDSAAARRTTESRRRGRALIFAAMLAALTMTVASPAHAAVPNAVAWGFNTDGELGNGGTGSSGVPVAVTGVAGVTAVAGGASHSLARLENGTAIAWGRNNAGQLGNGTTTNSDVPLAVCAVGTVGTCPGGPYLEGVAAIAAGGDQSMALLTNGRVVAWGTHVGDGTTTSSNVPALVCAKGTVGTCPSGPYLEGVTAIAAGTKFRLALTGGSLVAWGFNGEGELGNGTTTESLVPAQVSGLSEVTAIASGNFHSLALLKSGKVLAWGRGGTGQLGNGALTDSHVPVQVSEGFSSGQPLREATALAAGANFSLALLKDGKVVSWGANGSGQLGVGPKPGPEPCGEPPPFSCSKTPVLVEGLSAVTAIAAGEEHGLALLEGGTVRAWGSNSSGQLGVGTLTGPEACAGSGCSNTPVPVCAAGTEAPCPTGPFLSHVEGVGAGKLHSLAFGTKPVITNRQGKKQRHEPRRPKNGVQPNRGPSRGGTTVTISGSEFLGATQVQFGSTPATSFTVNSDSSITAVSPAGPRKTTVDVTVTSPWGTNATSEADHFRYRR
jgi:alpha-tubulin suppressor-like RCC1 family protein